MEVGKEIAEKELEIDEITSNNHLYNYSYSLQLLILINIGKNDKLKEREK